MKPIRWILAVTCVAALAFGIRPARADDLVKVGVCAPSLGPAIAPFAVGVKYGWFAKEGITIAPVAVNTATDCAKYVATGQFRYAMPSIEPLVGLHLQGVDARIFYTVCEGTNYGIAVPDDSPIHTIADLKGKRIGVTSLSSVGIYIVRALAQKAGLDGTHDISAVVVGQGAQTAELLRQKQADALSMFDTQYALVENAGVKLRLLDTPEIAGFPSYGFLALQSTLQTRRDEAVKLARVWAMASVFTFANPQAAIRAMWEVYPQTRATGKSEDQAMADDLRVLQARTANWQLERGGVTRWGESNPANYKDYLDFLTHWNVVKPGVEPGALITNDLVADINQFDADAIRRQAQAIPAR